MRRIDRIMEALLALPKGTGITASDLAEKTGYLRANISNDLNQLCRSGKVKKSGTKPVYYSVKSTNDSSDKTCIECKDTLDYFLSLNPSMFSCVEQAKAAILYPPRGMHMILAGETGTGKSMFAGLIYNYAVQKKIFHQNGKMISFNCADYTHNPQLLISQLFGVQKGAYTDANADKAGLLEQADGGMLFLDEVHRLPPEGQEMLFTYIDQGVFRRLGETDKERRVQVLLICATTEDTDSALLVTFTRRLPMMIRIPNLEQRDINERLGLISGFFTGEAKQLGYSIQVSVNTMRALMSYACPGNVGQLKTDIQIICARAYASYVTGKKGDLSISSFDLPDNIRVGLYTEKSHRYIYKYLGGFSKRFVEFSPKDHSIMPETELEDNIYKLLENQTKNMERLGFPNEKIQEEIEFHLYQYYQRICRESQNINPLSGVDRMVETEIIATAEKMLTLAEKKLDRKYDLSMRSGLAIHLKNAILRITEGHSIVNPRFNAVKTKYPRQFEIGLECLAIIKDDFGIEMPLDEAGYLALFFAGGTQLNQSSQSMVEVLVAAHGSSTASSIAQTVNSLLGKNIVVGFDVLLNESPRVVYNHIVKYLKSKSGVSEVLLLVDMGSLVAFARDLEHDLGISVSYIQLVSTAHVLEAARAALMHYPLIKVQYQAERVFKILEADLENSMLLCSHRLFILAICITGEGTALFLRELLNKTLNLANHQCEVLSVQCGDERELQQRLGVIQAQGKIIATVSSFNVALPYKNYLLADVLSGAALPKLQQLIELEAAYIGVQEGLFSMLEALRGSNAFEDIKHTIETMLDILGIEVSNDIMIGMICHMGCMLDRLKRQEPAGEFKEQENIISKYSDQFPVICRGMEKLGILYDVTIPIDEICYVTILIMKENLLDH